MTERCGLMAPGPQKEALAFLEPFGFRSRGGLILIRRVNALELAKLRRHAWIAQTAAGIAFALRGPPACVTWQSIQKPSVILVRNASRCLSGDEKILSPLQTSPSKMCETHRRNAAFLKRFRKLF